MLSKDGRRAVNRFNLVGRSNQRGALEHHLGSEFDEPQRQTALRAVDQLERDGLVAPTLQDLAAPRDWLTITERGVQALFRNTIDSLDVALISIDPHLLDIREGAWSSLASMEPDALRQAAHSGRELIDQTLKLGAPDAIVKSQPWFQPEKNSKTGVTRKHRLRVLVEQKRGSLSDNELQIADKACDLVLAVDQRLQAASHGREAPMRADIEDAMVAAEIALRRVLVPLVE
ncbi:MAG: hypothetical protein J0L57_09350 [Burkholderiales bacterium]|nr:hypothetical protein [Burkholderiales bacterium]